MKLIYSITLCFLLSINCTNRYFSEFNDNLNKRKISSIRDIITLFKNYYLVSFEYFESKVIQLHEYFKIRFNIQQPYDILAFFALGSIIKIILSFLTRKKDNYVYNSEDNSQYLFSILNKLDEITPLLETKSVNASSSMTTDQQLKQKIEITVESKSLINNLNSTMDSIQSQLNYLQSINKDLHETIQISQNAIKDELDKINDDEDEEDNEEDENIDNNNVNN